MGKFYADYSWPAASRFLALRRRNPTADLLHEGKKISNAPVIGDPAGFDAHDIDSFEVDSSVSWSDAKKWSFVCAVVRLVRRHSVAVGKLPVDHERFTKGIPKTRPNRTSVKTKHPPFKKARTVGHRSGGVVGLGS